MNKSFQPHEAHIPFPLQVGRVCLLCHLSLFNHLKFQVGKSETKQDRKSESWYLIMYFQVARHVFIYELFLPGCLVFAVVI